MPKGVREVCDLSCGKYSQTDTLSVLGSLSIGEIKNGKYLTWRASLLLGLVLRVASRSLSH